MKPIFDYLESPPELPGPIQEERPQTVPLTALSLDTETPPERGPHLQAFAPGRTVEINLHYLYLELSDAPEHSYYCIPRRIRVSPSVTPAILGVSDSWNGVFVG